MSFRTAISDLSGTRDWFCGRQFSTGGCKVWFRDDSSALLPCALHLYCCSTSDHQASDPGGWTPLLQRCVCAESYPTLCDPTDCSPPDSPVHGLFQARILEWVAISSSSRSSQCRDQTHASCTGKWIWQMDSLPLSHQRSPVHYV